MSCRVLGREVERATLAILLDETRRRGAREILGRYRPSAKNNMVADLLPRLGFAVLGADGEDMLYIRQVNAPFDADLPMTISKEHP
jgi:predicted enzyme involved in methoxymalonyl-ACP biosynthesis